MEEGEARPCLAECVFVLPPACFPGRGAPSPVMLSAALSPPVGTPCVVKLSQGLCLLTWGFPAGQQGNVEQSLPSKARSIAEIQVDNFEMDSCEYCVWKRFRRKMFVVTDVC